MRYKTGLYGGAFNPLHMGHVDSLIQAANLCVRLFVVLWAGRNRNEIDMLVRYRWIYRLTAHIGNVTILTVEDDAPSISQYTHEMALEHARQIRDQIKDGIDVIFTDDDTDERSCFKLTCREAAIHHFDNTMGISSKVLRADPYGHWDWLPAVVRPHYTRKVLLIGGESTGKSTLTLNLTSRFNAISIDEAGRELSFKSGTPDRMLSEDYVEILLQQKLNEIKALEQGKKVLFVDTDTLITQFYINFFEDPQSRLNKALSDAIDSINRFDLIIFLEPDVDFIHDGDRSMVIASQREKYSNQIKDIFESHNRRFVTVSGDYQSRYEQAVALVNALLEPQA